MKILLVLSLALVAVNAQYDYPQYYQPIPYSFNYAADTEDGGSSSHQEVGDGAGRVQGSYTVAGIDGGFGRVVEYVADENGFRANVRTNEPGTANQNPADVVVESSAPVVGAPASYAVQPARAPVRVAGTPGGLRYVVVPGRY